MNNKNKSKSKSKSKSKKKRENYAKPFENNFKNISKGSSFCTFEGVMYKVRTLAKFPKSRNKLLLFVSTSIGNDILKVASHFGMICLF